MKLGQQQELFSRLRNNLESFILSQGYEIRGGDLFRDPRLHGHYGEDNPCYYEDGTKAGYSSKNSMHKLKLAVDLYLTKDGVYLTKTSDYEFAGLYWEGLHELCRWGGRFSDGNHFSLTWDGKA